MLTNCIECGSHMTPAPNKKYCTSSCKQKAYERRRSAGSLTSDTYVSERRQITEDVFNMLIKSKDSNTSLEVQNAVSEMKFEFINIRMSDFEKQVDKRLKDIEDQLDEINHIIEELEPKPHTEKLMTIIENVAPAIAGALIQKNQSKENG